MVASRDGFSHLGLKECSKANANFYQARLSRLLDRKTIGLGSDKITALNLARMLDEEIERLIRSNEPIELDKLKQMVQTELEKTKAKKTQSIRLVEKDDLAMLWDKYVSFHRAINHWEESYILTHIQTVGEIIKRSPYQKLEQKQEFLEWLFSESERRSVKTSKARFKLIVAAIDWNSKQGNIPRKWGIEYRDLLESISIKEKKKNKVSTSDTENEEIEIFRVSEVYEIIRAFKEELYSRFDGKHCQYWKYIYFLWLTGCRPSEAIALKWENVNIAKKQIKFCEGEVRVSGNLIKKEGTKTVDVRYFPINNELMELLNSMPYKHGYVFTRQDGSAVNQQAFLRVWKTVIKAMGIKYRIPYQLRHTMISYHANNDYPLHKLSEIVGNSEEMIKEHYLKLDIERISLPEIKIEKQ